VTDFMAGGKITSGPAAPDGRSVNGKPRVFVQIEALQGRYGRRI
jgi:hypothetical protein